MTIKHYGVEDHILNEEGRRPKVPRAQAILQQHPRGYRQGDHAR